MPLNYSKWDQLEVSSEYSVQWHQVCLSRGSKLMMAWTGIAAQRRQRCGSASKVSISRTISDYNRIADLSPSSVDKKSFIRWGS